VAGDADKLTLLHDHYKETFALIRERETQRDRLFLWLLVIFALLVIEIQYPANFHGVLGHVNVAGNNIDLQQLPLARLLNVSWVFTAAFVLKYCQVAKAVERQYTYLHLLEDRISDGLGDADLYRREGRAYREQYPHLLNWAWVYYTILFPAALAIAVVYLLVVECVSLQGSVLSKAFDVVFGVSILASLGLYRIRPRPGTDTGGAPASLLPKIPAKDPGTDTAPENPVDH
jgi:hypothetical protein